MSYILHLKKKKVTTDVIDNFRASMTVGRLCDSPGWDRYVKILFFSNPTGVCTPAAIAAKSEQGQWLCLCVEERGILTTHSKRTRSPQEKKSNKIDVRRSEAGIITLPQKRRLINILKKWGDGDSVWISVTLHQPDTNVTG